MKKVNIEFESESAFINFATTACCASEIEYSGDQCLSKCLCTDCWRATCNIVIKEVGVEKDWLENDNDRPKLSKALCNAYRVKYIIELMYPAISVKVYDLPQYKKVDFDMYIKINGKFWRYYECVVYDRLTNSINSVAEFIMKAFLDEYLKTMVSESTDLDINVID